MTTLTFQTTTLSVINQHNQTWLLASEIGKALGYPHPIKGIQKIYDRHRDEFSAGTTQLVEMQTAGGMQKVRIFSLRGCHLIGMLSHTKVAKEFRRWVLYILDKEIGNVQNVQPNLPLAKPKPEVTITLSLDELCDIAWAVYSAKRQNALINDLRKPLSAIGSRFATEADDYGREYKRCWEMAFPAIQTIFNQIDADQYTDISGWKHIVNNFKKSASNTEQIAKRYQSFVSR